MLNKIVYKKCTKIPKNEKNERYANTNIFKRVVDMILIVFVGSNRPFGLPLTRISWHKDPYSKKPRPFQATVAFLAIFNPFFTYRGLNINIQSTPVDQNFVRCFSCPKGASVQISSHLDIQIQKNSISKVVVPRSPFSNKYVHIHILLTCIQRMIFQVLIH